KKTTNPDRAIDRLNDLDPLPGHLKTDAGIGNVTQMLDDEAIQRFGPVKRKLRPEPAVERAELRHSVHHDAAVRLAPEAVRRPRRLSREFPDDFLDDVLACHEPLQFAVFVHD